MEEKVVKNPCKDCSKRHEVCHTKCVCYLAYREYKDKQLEKNKQLIYGTPEMTPKMKKYIARKKRWK